MMRGMMASLEKHALTPDEFTHGEQGGLGIFPKR
jgi:hypothetical protein